MGITEVKKLAKKAQLKEFKILEGLEHYYKGEYSLGYTAKRLKIPLRALMEFMTKQDLPYYWKEQDRKRGLKRISEIRPCL